ncbi:MAG: S8 family serine peptidase [Candidatus Thiodiazotropha sp.]
MKASRNLTAGCTLLIALGLMSITATAARLDPSLSKPGDLTQVSKPRSSEKASEHYTWNKNTDPGKLILKMHDDSQARLKGNTLYTSDTKNSRLVNALQQINQRIAETRAKITQALPVTLDTLEKRRHEAQQNTNAKLADLSQYFLIALPKGASTKALIDSLNATAYVQLAYASMRLTAAPVDISPPTPPFTDLQTYSGAAPLGIDTDYVYENTNINASGITVADIEQCWTFTHEDLGLININGDALVGPEVTSDLDPLSNDCSHGTAVVGILAADDNEYGVTGLIPDARIKVATVMPQANTGSSSLNRASALATLALADTAPMQAGDVILLEQQTGGPHWDGNPNNCYGCLPVEYDQIVFDVIRNITALNIHVVEAGGNGSQNLDSLVGEPNPGVGTGSPEYQRLSFSENYSGAIVTGAARADSNHARMLFSNYGERIDSFSWGEGIATTGYGPNLNSIFFSIFDDPNQWYTGNFGGTSGASPIITSAVALLQAQHKDLYQSNYLPDAMRLLLRTTGTPSSNPEEQWIGYQPDLKIQTELVKSGPNLAAVLQGDGNFSNGLIGGSVAYVGDQDNDTFGDIAVAETDSSGGNVTIHVYSGITGQSINSFQLPGLGYPDQRVSMANAGDVDNDGLDDLLIGQSTSSTNGYGNVSVMTRIATQPAYFRNYVGEAGSRFGFSVAASDDLNGDGVPDYLIGAPSESANSNTQHEGALYIYSGAASNSLLTKKYGVAGSEYGYSVVPLEDWNGDGRGDFAVGAPGYPFGSAGRIGRVLIYDGPSMSLHDAYYCNVDEGERCGEAIADAGDLTGEGDNEILIGAPGAFNGQGSVIAYSPSHGYVDTWTRMDSREFGTNLLTRTCTNCSNGTGTYVASLGFETVTGALHRLPAPYESVSDDYVSPGSSFGYAQSLAAGDINNDGRADLIVGDPGSDRVFIYLK